MTDTGFFMKAKGKQNMRKTILLATLMMGMVVLAEASSRCDKGVCQVAPDETQH